MKKINQISDNFANPHPHKEIDFPNGNGQYFYGKKE